ncbi:MAG: hypothetical protein AB1Z98_29840 [Nannocystaceae bacterium]
MHAITRTFVLALTATACSTAAPEPTASAATTDLEELHAFARLYGYVR